MLLDTEVSDFTLRQNCYNFRMVEKELLPIIATV